MGKMNLTRVCLYFFGFTKVSVVAPCFLSTSKNRCRCFKWEERVKWAAWSYSFQYNTFLLFFFLKRKDIFFQQTLFYLWVMFLMFLFCWHEFVVVAFMPFRWACRGMGHRGTCRPHPRGQPTRPKEPWCPPWGSHQLLKGIESAGISDVKQTSSYTKITTLLQSLMNGKLSQTRPSEWAHQDDFNNTLQPMA